MKSRNIIIADSNPSFMDSIGQVLQEEGYGVMTASSGMDVLEMIKHQPCYCVFLDLMIPKVDGARVCRYIKEDRALSHIPVGILSGTIAENVPYLDDIGADFYIAKGPMDSMKKNILTVLKQLETGPRVHEEKTPVLGINSLFPRTVTKDLLNYQRHHETILRNMGEGVIEIDTDFKVLRINPAGLLIFQTLERKVVGSTLFGLFGNNQKVHEALSTLSIAKEYRNEKLTLGYQDKTLRVVCTNLIENSCNKGFLLIVQDITDLSRKIEELTLTNDELKRTQAQLIQAAKLSALGQMAANITHEINTPLTSVLGYVSLLLNSTDDADSRKGDLKIIQSEALRARNIIRGLLNFAYQEEINIQKLDIRELVKETLILVYNRAKAQKVTMVEHYGEKSLCVEVDANQMKQVLINLINNAFDAMPQGGTLTITTFSEDNLLNIRFQDTGAGISPDTLSEIFDPFFTTKQKTRGTGLGLSLSLKIVKGFGGSIEVESDEGKGSAFTVEIPLKGEKDTCDA
jgi:signal transduction histidine kinase/ActR/RegA family two-component response regulator